MPLKINSNRVFKFSGLGLVTKMFEYPCASAAAMAKPRAADFPRPRPAVRVTVDESVFSAMASTNVRIAWAWSIVFASLTTSPIGLVSARLSLRSLSSASILVSVSCACSTCMQRWLCQLAEAQDDDVIAHGTPSCAFQTCVSHQHSPPWPLKHRWPSGALQHRRSQG